MSNNVVKEPQTCAFGELQVANLRTITQISAVYGILDNAVTIESGTGSVSASNELFTCSTGVSSSGTAAIQTARQLAYKAGQGGLCRITALFTEGVANSQQIAGLITAEDRLCFGYDGATFGILRGHDGKAENNHLTITTPASGSENATLTVDGTNYTVPLTAGTAEHNAYEIATSMATQDLLHEYESVGDEVRILSIIDGPEGAYAFTSATAVGTISQEVAGVAISEEWIQQANWNGTAVTIDPTKGNVYQIQFQYLGFGAIKFFIEDSETGDFVLVHTIQYSNTSISTSVSNPTFRVGWAAQNRGNTTDIVTKGASCGAFIEGDGKQSDDTRCKFVEATGIGTTETTILTMRNSFEFKNRVNRVELQPILLTLGTDTAKTATFIIRKNPEITGDVIYSEIDPNSPLHVSEDNNSVTGGKIMMAFNANNGSFPLAELEGKLLFLPRDVLTISAKVSSGAASEMQASFTFREDF